MIGFCPVIGPTIMSINMKNAPTNCTDLVRERKNRFRTFYPQRTSKPAAVLASSFFTDLEISLQTVQEEGRKSH